MKFAAAPNADGKTMDIWLLHDEGPKAHTEPICTVSTEWHPWFVSWLLKQPCPVRFTELFDEANHAS